MRRSRRHKRKSCINKQRFEKPWQARLAMRALKKKNVMVTHMHVYKCKYCHGWHFGRTNEVEYVNFDKLR